MSYQVIRRFQIEDLIAQDASGVIFRAFDSETGKTVAVRRFFPFGVDGGGLHADEQTAYNIAVDRLAGLSHPALRSVISGGCDPVDSIPYIATEWVEGPSIHAIIQQQGPLATEVATHLITQALEVCELLSHVLAEEAVWVETELQTIITSSDSSSRGFTFWISPLKWLGGHDKSHGLESIVTLTEQIMGWQGRSVMDHAGHGLGGWLKWLRNAAATTSLHEAREMLAASVGVDPPPPAKTLAAQATRQLVKTPKPPSFKVPWVINFGLALLAVGLGAGFLIRQRAKQASPQVRTPALTNAQTAPQGPVILSDAAQASRRAAELSAQAQQEDQQHAILLAQQQAAAQKMDGVIAWTSRELLVHNEGAQVVVEGVLEKIDFSGTRKTLYLMFSKEPDENDPRGAVILKTAAADLAAETLTPLIGKKIRLHGMVKLQKGFDLKRPEIQIKERASIEIIE